MPDRLGIMTGIAVWFLAALAAGGMGLFVVQSPQQPPLALGLGVFVPVLVFIILYRSLPSFRRTAQAADLSILACVHIWRLLAIDFLILCAHGHLPAGFAVPAGIGDIITAVIAIPIAMAFRRDPIRVRPWFIVWNVFGLIDLVTAVSLGILYSESAWGFLAGTGPTTNLMVVLPRSMVPTFFVPLFISLHFLAIVRSRK
jgi:hypothetical protein